MLTTEFTIYLLQEVYKERGYLVACEVEPAKIGCIVTSINLESGYKFKQPFRYSAVTNKLDAIEQSRLWCLLSGGDFEHEKGFVEQFNFFYRITTD